MGRHFFRIDEQRSSHLHLDDPVGPGMVSRGQSSFSKYNNLCPHSFRVLSGMGNSGRIHAPERRILCLQLPDPASHAGDDHQLLERRLHHAGLDLRAGSLVLADWNAPDCRGPHRRGGYGHSPGFGLGPLSRHLSGQYFRLSHGSHGDEELLFGAAGAGGYFSFGHYGGGHHLCPDQSSGFYRPLGRIRRPPGRGRI